MLFFKWKIYNNQLLNHFMVGCKYLKINALFSIFIFCLNTVNARAVAICYSVLINLSSFVFNLIDLNLIYAGIHKNVEKRRTVKKPSLSPKSLNQRKLRHRRVWK